MQVSFNKNPAISVQKCHHNNFEHSIILRKEGRVLLTSSAKLLARKDCPPGAYLIDPRALEECLCHILLLHGVVLRPEKFLSRCVVCNGTIIEIDDQKDGSLRRDILRANKAPETLDVTIFACDFCLQCCWWSDKPNSGRSRFKAAATQLFIVALRAGVPYEEPLGFFDYVNVEKERMAGGLHEFPTFDALEWLNNSKLSHPLQLHSSYADEVDEDVEDLPFTNVTSSFVGCLDYIFYEPQHMQLVERLDVPRSFAQINTSLIPEGHLIPSDVWPSDHLAIGSGFCLRKYHNDHL